MKNLLQSKKIYMVGIGGIGMSGLASLLSEKGIAVSGSDMTLSDITEHLSTTYGIIISQVPKKEYITKDIDYLIYSPAVAIDNIERKEAFALGIEQLSYPEALGILSKNSKTITISGTNGKTTTTSMIVELLDFHKNKPQAIVGEFLQKYQSNYINGSNDLFVVEACEYKNSFLNIHHDVCIVTNITEDHLDFFKDIDDIKKSFSNYMNNKKGTGVLICNTKQNEVHELVHTANKLGIKVYDFSLYLKDITVSIPGEHNKENAAAALCLMNHLGYNMDTSREYLANQFKGAKRRFEFHGKTISGGMLYDDYAHNPIGLNYIIEALRKEHPSKKIVMIFEPHLYSRTRDFKNEFAKALQQVDTLYLLPTYRAREPYQKEEDFLLADFIDKNEVNLIKVNHNDNFKDLYLSGNHSSEDITITAGAGDVWKKGKEIQQ